MDITEGSITSMLTTLPKDVSVFDLFFDISKTQWQEWKDVYT